jgi:hypothetical protein
MISMKTLNKWRSEALDLRNRVHNGEISSVHIAPLSEHILRLTQELIDQKLLEGKK